MQQIKNQNNFEGIAWFWILDPGSWEKSSVLKYATKASKFLISVFYSLQGSEFENGRRGSLLGTRCSVLLSAELFSSYSRRVNIGQIFWSKMVLLFTRMKLDFLVQFNWVFLPGDFMKNMIFPDSFPVSRSEARWFNFKQCTKCWSWFRTVAVAGWCPRFQVHRRTSYWNCFHQQKRKGRKILFSFERITFSHG